MGSALFELKSFVLNHTFQEDPGRGVSCFERSSTSLPCVTPAAPSMSQEHKREVRTFSREKKRNNCDRNPTEAHSQTIQCQLHSRKADPNGQLQQSCLISYTEEGRGCISAKSCIATNSSQLNGTLLLAG